MNADLVAAIVAMLSTNGVARPVAMKRTNSIASVCAAASHDNPFLAALCIVNACDESKVDPANIGDHGLAIGLHQLHPEFDPARINRRAALGPAYRWDRWMQLMCQDATRYDLAGSSCMFIASYEFWYIETGNEVRALATHMSGVRGGTTKTRSMARRRIRIARTLVNVR